jgi:hypothetical protein
MKLNKLFVWWKSNCGKKWGYVDVKNMEVIWKQTQVLFDRKGKIKNEIK